MKAKGIEAPDFPIFPPWEQVLNYLGSDRDHGDLLNCWFLFPQTVELLSYPLVNIQKAIENGPVEIVDLPIKNGGSFHIVTLVYQRVLSLI